MTSDINLHDTKPTREADEKAAVLSYGMSGMDALARYIQFVSDRCRRLGVFDDLVLEDDPLRDIPAADSIRDILGQRGYQITRK